MQVINRESISTILDKDAVIDVVKEAFIAHAKGEINSPLPMHIEFKAPNDDYIGDCHVKAGNASHLPYFAVKLASGFYKNPDLGLPVNQGLVLLMSASTGQPVALLQDEGLLTSARTAAAGAIGAGLRASHHNDALGIIGTGHQAEQQAIWVSHHLKLNKLFVFGRSKEKAKLLANKLKAMDLNAVVADSVSELCSRSDMLITTTPAREAVIKSSDISKPIHIVAMGSDIPGKQELDSDILKRADIIVNDDIVQCLDHGETGCAVRAGLIENTKAISLGSALEDELQFSRDWISVVDLTGLGAQDLAIANLVAHKLGL